MDKAELMGGLESTVAESMAVLRALKPERLMETVKRQNYNVTMLEGIFTCVENFGERIRGRLFL